MSSFNFTCMYIAFKINVLNVENRMISKIVYVSREFKDKWTRTSYLSQGQLSVEWTLRATRVVHFRFSNNHHSVHGVFPYHLN